MKYVVMLLFFVSFVTATDTYDEGTYGSGSYGASVCGDGVCDGGESCGSCTTDCGACLVETTGGHVVPAGKPVATGAEPITLSVFGRQHFLVQGIQHSVRIAEIGEGTVVLEFRSDAIAVTLGEGETKNVDIDDDDVPDMSVTVLHIYQAAVSLTIRPVNDVSEAANPEDVIPSDFIVSENELAVALSPPAVIVGAGRSGSWYVLVILLGAALLSVWFYRTEH